MKRFLKFTGIGIVVLAVIAVAAMFFMKKQTKTFSPEEQVNFSQDDLTINVFYNRPYKKGRKIFGELVPYGKVWRTGANEATTFETNKDLNFEGKTLKKGKYSLWTVPGQDNWKIIFNTEVGQWGIKFNGEANYDPSKDALTIDATPFQQEREFEQFTISFEQMGEDAEMVLMWDKTLVAVPFAH